MCIPRFDNKPKGLLFNHTPAHQTYILGENVRVLWEYRTGGIVSACMQKARPYNNHQSEPGAAVLGEGGLVEAEEERARLFVAKR
jgi:hypothetical protein